MSNEIKYIGSEYSSSDSNTFFNEKSQENYFFPSILNDKKRCYFETGTDSLAAIIKEIKTEKPICIWFPVNYCYETIHRLNLKLMNKKIYVKHYSKYDEIKPSVSFLNLIILLHFNRYNANHISLFLKKFKNFIIIEDFVHAPLDIKKFRGNFAFNSLRKFSDIEVSVAYLNQKTQLSSFSSDYYNYKKNAANLKSVFLKNKFPIVEKQYLSLFKKANEFLMNSNIFCGYAPESARLTIIDLKKILSVRKKNYQHLCKEIKNIREIKLLAGDYMYLIFECINRNNLKKYLAENKIFTAIHWKDSNSAISKKIISLHIDHRYSFKEMNRIAEKINEFYSK